MFRWFILNGDHAYLHAENGLDILSTHVSCKLILFYFMIYSNRTQLGHICSAERVASSDLIENDITNGTSAVVMNDYRLFGDMWPNPERG